MCHSGIRPWSVFRGDKFLGTVWVSRNTSTEDAIQQARVEGYFGADRVVLYEPRGLPTRGGPAKNGKGRGKKQQAEREPTLDELVATAKPKQTQQAVDPVAMMVAMAVGKPKQAGKTQTPATKQTPKQTATIDIVALMVAATGR